MATTTVAHSIELVANGVCPTMSLVATKLGADAVWIYRPSKETIDPNDRVWDIEPPFSACHFLWHENGRLFIIADGEGHWGIWNAMDGEKIIDLSVNHGVDCMLWVNGSTRDNIQGEKFKDLTSLTIIDDLDTMKNGALYNQLSRDAIDFLILANGANVTLVFAGNFIVNANASVSTANIFDMDRLIVKGIKSGATLEWHFVLLQDTVDRSFKVVKLNTKFVNMAKLSDVTFTCSKLQAAMDIIETSIKSINGGYRPFVDYTVRIIDFLKEELNNGDPVYELYDLLLTGSCSTSMQKWLTDYVGERGIKRWSKLGGTHFENSRSVIFNDLIPSITHLIANTSKLKSINDSLTDSVAFQALLKRCYTFSLELSEFERQFEKMMEWLTLILKEITGDDTKGLSTDIPQVVKFLGFINEIENEIMDVGELNELFNKVCHEIRAIFENVRAEIRSTVAYEPYVEVYHGGGEMEVEMAVYEDQLTILKWNKELVEVVTDGGSILSQLWIMPEFDFKGAHLISKDKDQMLFVLGSELAIVRMPPRGSKSIFDRGMIVKSFSTGFPIGAVAVTVAGAVAVAMHENGKQFGWISADFAK